MSNLIPVVVPFLLLGLEVAALPESFWVLVGRAALQSAMNPSVVLALPPIILHVWLDKGISGRGWGFIK